MKKVFLIILIAFLCVIGAIGIGIGGMYLFGGFNEEVVYASELHFNETEVVSSESIFLQIDTETEGVTRRTLKLVASTGGESIINFPQTVRIGEYFRVIPKMKNGVNVGGNVTLTAQYDDSNANVSAVAKCNLLIDIPIKSATVKLNTINTGKLDPNQELTLCKKGEELVKHFNILPSVDALAPYGTSGVLNDVIKQNLTDKILFMELVSVNKDTIIKDIAYLMDGDNNDKPYDTPLVEIKYKWEGKKLVCDNTIKLKVGNVISSEARINLYTYSTYKEQNKNANGPNIDINRDKALTNKTDFSIGKYKIDELTIFNKTETQDENRNVLLNNEVKIYLNNPDASENDINLSMKLKANESPDIYISNQEYKDNVYLNISTKGYEGDADGNDNDPVRNFITLTRMDGSNDAVEGKGLNINCETLSDQISTWYWVLRIHNFQAYYNYFKNKVSLTATFLYSSADSSAPEKTFNIIPTINQINSLSPKYNEGETAFLVKSGDVFNVNEDLVTKTSNVTSTYTPEFAFYLDYAINYDGGTTLLTIPNRPGEYKAEFSFTTQEEIPDEELEAINITYDESWATINSKEIVKDKNNKNLYKVSVYLTIKTAKQEDTLFRIEGYDKAITKYMVKFYEQIEDSQNYKDIPFLSIGGVKYSVKYDFYKDESDVSGKNYLKIDNREFFENAYIVSGIGSFIITVQLVHTEGGVTYWLGVSTNIEVSIYEQLATLYASFYKDSNEYDAVFKTDYKEDDSTTYNIFITSDEIEALKNYVSRGQVDYSFSQVFDERVVGDVDISTYKGIEEINNSEDYKAITFGNKFVEVIKDDLIIGYRLSYKINKIDSIKIDEIEHLLENIFRISISIDVDREGTIVPAKFKIPTATEGGSTTENYLDIRIEDKIITEAVLNYNVSGNNGTSVESAIDLVGTTDTLGNFYYLGDSIKDNLKYHFKFNDGITTTIDTLTYSLNIVKPDNYCPTCKEIVPNEKIQKEEDGNGNICDVCGSKLVKSPLNINLAGLCEFTKTEDTTITKPDEEDVVASTSGKGGLVFHNFPLNLNRDGINEGVIVEFKILSPESKQSGDDAAARNLINTHKEYIKNPLTGGGFFERTLNENLKASLFFKIFGVEISIEANKNVDITGYKDNVVNVFNGTNENPSIFNINVKDFNGDDLTVSDYTQLFTADAPSEYVSFAKVGNKDDYSRLIVKKDCLESCLVPFSFYIGTPADANKIKIEGGDAGGYLFTQTIKPAYEVTFLNSRRFFAPSIDNQIATVEYLKENNDIDIDKLVTINIIVPEEYKSLVKKQDNSNLITFVTVPKEYTVNLTLSITKKHDDGSTSYLPVPFTITVTPKFEENNLVVGSNINGVTGIYAGSTDNTATFSGELDKVKNNITEVAIEFKDEDETTRIKVNEHMDKVVSFIKISDDQKQFEKLSISSLNLNYNKDITIIITFKFKDGGTFVFTKTHFRIFANLKLEFSKQEIEVDNANEPFLLTRKDNYKFTAITPDGTEVDKTTEFDEKVLSSFDFNNGSATNYCKDDFIFDANANKAFEIINNQDDGIFELRVRYETLINDNEVKENGGKIDITISLVYKELRYNLVFDLHLTIKVVNSSSGV